MKDLLSLPSTPFFQVAVLLLSATLVVASLALIVATRKLARPVDSEAGLALLDRPPAQTQADPVPGGTAVQALLRRRKTKALEPLYLPKRPEGACTQRRLLEMMKSKRSQLAQPDLGSAYKFALVNRHLRQVFTEHRVHPDLPVVTPRQPRYQQQQTPELMSTNTWPQGVPSELVPARPSTPGVPSLTVVKARPWASSAAYSPPSQKCHWAQSSSEIAESITAIGVFA